MAVSLPRLAALGRRRPRLPAALAEVRDTLLVVAALVVLWQVLHEVAGDVALSSPAATV